MPEASTEASAAVVAVAMASFGAAEVEWVVAAFRKVAAVAVHMAPENSSSCWVLGKVDRTPSSDTSTRRHSDSHGNSLGEMGTERATLAAAEPEAVMAVAPVATFYSTDPFFNSEQAKN